MIWQMKIVGIYLENICTMNGAWGKKVILRFQITNLLDTPFRFFANKSYIFEKFLEEIFVVDFFTVLLPSKLVLIILDLN